MKARVKVILLLGLLVIGGVFTARKTLFSNTISISRFLVSSSVISQGNIHVFGMYTDTLLSAISCDSLNTDMVRTLVMQSGHWQQHLIDDGFYMGDSCVLDSLIVVSWGCLSGGGADIRGNKPGESGMSGGTKAIGQDTIAVSYNVQICCGDCGTGGGGSGGGGSGGYSCPSCPGGTTPGRLDKVFGVNGGFDCRYVTNDDSARAYFDRYVKNSVNPYQVLAQEGIDGVASAQVIYNGYGSCYQGGEDEFGGFNYSVFEIYYSICYCQTSGATCDTANHPYVEVFYSMSVPLATEMYDGLYSLSTTTLDQLLNMSGVTATPQELVGGTMNDAMIEYVRKQFAIKYAGRKPRPEYIRVCSATTGTYAPSNYSNGYLYLNHWKLVYYADVDSFDNSNSDYDSGYDSSLPGDDPREAFVKSNNQSLLEKWRQILGIDPSIDVSGSFTIQDVWQRIIDRWTSYFYNNNKLKVNANNDIAKLDFELNQGIYLPKRRHYRIFDLSSGLNLKMSCAGLDFWTDLKARLNLNNLQDYIADVVATKAWALLYSLVASVPGVANTINGITKIGGLSLTKDIDLCHDLEKVTQSLPAEKNLSVSERWCINSKLALGVANSFEEAKDMCIDEQKAATLQTGGMDSVSVSLTDMECWKNRYRDTTQYAGAFAKALIGDITVTPTTQASGTRIVKTKTWTGQPIDTFVFIPIRDTLSSLMEGIVEEYREFFTSQDSRVDITDYVNALKGLNITGYIDLPVLQAIATIDDDVVRERYVSAYAELIAYNYTLQLFNLARLAIRGCLFTGDDYSSFTNVKDEILKRYNVILTDLSLLEKEVDPDAKKEMLKSVQDYYVSSVTKQLGDLLQAYGASGVKDFSFGE